jgi:hypothetical protein
MGETQATPAAVSSPAKVVMKLKPDLPGSLVHKTPVSDSRIAPHALTPPGPPGQQREFWKNHALPIAKTPHLTPPRPAGTTAGGGSFRSWFAVLAAHTTPARRDNSGRSVALRTTAGTISLTPPRPAGTTAGGHHRVEFLSHSAAHATPARRDNSGRQPEGPAIPAGALPPHTTPARRDNSGR